MGRGGLILWLPFKGLLIISLEFVTCMWRVSSHNPPQPPPPRCQHQKISPTHQAGLLGIFRQSIAPHAIPDLPEAFFYSGPGIYLLLFFLTLFIPVFLLIFLCPFTKYRESCLLGTQPSVPCLTVYPTLLIAPGEHDPQWSCMLQLLLRQASKFLPTSFLAVSELSERQMLLGGDSILRDSYMQKLPKVGKV